MNTYQRNFTPKIRPIWKEKRIIKKNGNIVNGLGEFIGYGKIEFDNTGAWKLPANHFRASKKKSALIKR